MREITRERLIEDRDILLFDILQELKRMNLRADLEIMPTHVPHLRTETYTKVPDIVSITTASTETKMYKCKYCGEKHEEPWQIAKCGKNLKKEGGK